MLERLFTKTFGLLERALDIRSARHRAITANIANQETPGYKAVDVSFQEAIRSVSGTTSPSPLARTAPGHMAMAKADASGGHIPVTRSSQSNRLDGNSVKPEKEMAKLAENTLLYNATVQLLAAKFRGIKNVIREGR